MERKKVNKRRNCKTDGKENKSRRIKKKNIRKSVKEIVSKNTENKKERR